MKNINFRNKLVGKLQFNDIMEICYYTQCPYNDANKEKLYQLTFDENEKVSSNALLVFSKFSLSDNEWLYFKHDELINRVMQEKNKTKCRLMLDLLLRQPFSKINLRSDFIDFCLSKISSNEPIAIRVLCIKLAYEQCKHHPELSDELKHVLYMVKSEPISAGISCAIKNVLNKME